MKLLILVSLIALASANINAIDNLVDFFAGVSGV